MSEKKLSSPLPVRYQAKFRGSLLVGYSVTDDGKFWSCLSRVKGGKIAFVPTKEWKLIKPFAAGTRRQYYYVSFSLYGKITKTSLHRIVFESIVGKIPDNHDICHNDGNPKNNEITNLRSATRQENLMDKVKHGTSQNGERNSQAKLSNLQVEKIKELRNGGCKLKTIASMFGVTESTVCVIAKNKSRVM